jgi:hypothetical protein
MAGYSGTPLVKKIGIKPADRVLFSGAPRSFEKEIAPLPEGVQLVSGASRDLNVALFFTDTRAQLEKQLPKLKERIAQNGMIWVAWPKKASRVPTDLTEDVIRDTALALGLVDVKVCAVDEVWSGLKLVIPVKLRSKP